MGSQDDFKSFGGNKDDDMDSDAILLAIEQKCDEITMYGCWCPTLGGDVGEALRGAPVDEIDSTCREWQKCKHCNALQPWGCVNTAVNYVESVGGNQLTCDAYVNDMCAHNQCKCDLQFAAKIISIMGSW